MCDEFIHQGLVDDARLSRRAFGLIAVTAAGSASAALTPPAVSEKDVTIRTPDGLCDAALFTPKAAGRFPAVLMWPDIMGLRPVFRDMGRRLAAEGYVVLVPNPFYRTRRAPVVEGTFNFGDPAQRAVLMGYRKAMTEEGPARDAVAFLDFLDKQPKTNRARKAGVQGYCMGGGLSFQGAAAVPSRIGAVASFHGGNGLVGKDRTSPNLLIPRTRAAFLVLQAQNDDAQAPEVKNQLKAAFAAAHKPALVDVYPANHGWCVPGGQAYDPAQAERAWSELLSLYRRALT